MAGESFEPWLDRAPDSDTLVILIHGLRGGPKQLDGLKHCVRSAYPGCDTFAPPMPYGGCKLLTWTSPAKALADLVGAIDAIWAQKNGTGPGYRSIVVVGYSIGALFARRVAIAAYGEKASAPFEPELSGFAERREWAGAIRRVVFLAGMTKGWEPTQALSTINTIFWRAAGLVLEFTPARYGVLLEARSGYPFVAQTRLQWLALMRRNPAPDFDVVQLLGTIDDLVSPDDMIDVAVDLMREDKFTLLELPNTGHRDAVRVARPGPDLASEPSKGAVRWALFAKAVFQPSATLASDPQSVPFALLSDGSLARPDPTVTDVVFVVHGIRDKGFWTKKIARAIRREAAASGEVRKVQSMTMSYGYLPMLPFIFPAIRRGKTAWLMDRYVEARALYPEAVFHYVGHSNGTYLAARALADYPAVRFGRIVFGGSVVRSNFDWRSHVRAGRLRSILNYVATGDWVVAIIPSGLGLLDLGGGGHSGFRQLGAPGRGDRAAVAATPLGTEPSYQLNYIKGSHSAAIRESQWDEIAGFVVSGTSPSVDDTSDYKGRQSPLVRTLGLLPPLFLLILVAALVALYVYAGLNLGILAWIVGALLLATILWLV